MISGKALPAMPEGLVAFDLCNESVPEPQSHVPGLQVPRVVHTEAAQEADHRQAQAPSW